MSATVLNKFSMGFQVAPFSLPCPAAPFPALPLAYLPPLLPYPIPLSPLLTLPLFLMGPPLAAEVKMNI